MRYAGLLCEAQTWPRISTKTRTARSAARGVAVRGVVQGVGFRPFVYRLATEEGLAGFIGNDTGGVTIEIEGPADASKPFAAAFAPKRRPSRASILLLCARLPPKGEKDSASSPARSRGQVSTGIPADAATCADCLRELLDPARPPLPLSVSQLHQLRPALHHHAPHSLRPPADFDGALQNVPACQAEYDDPANRRFHAQPNACWVAARASGWSTPTAQRFRPTIRWLRTIDRLWPARSWPSKALADSISRVDATNEAAVMRLRERKHRYGKPLAVMVRDLEAARAVCVLTAEEESLLLTIARPIVLAAARQAAASRRPSRPEFHGSAFFFPTRRCSTCSLPIRAFAPWS